MTSKIVPREPTPRMTLATADLVLPRDKAEAAEAVWRAMYDAAPAMEKPAEDASAADADEKLIEQLHGPHGSGLLHRLEGAQKMHDAGKSISTWVASAIDNEAAKWIRQAADRIAELRAEIDEARSYASHLATTMAAHDGAIEDWRPLPDLIGLLTQIDNMAAGRRIRAEAAEAERDRLREELGRALSALQQAEKWGYLP